jgi:hypothetical protein
MMIIKMMMMTSFKRRGEMSVLEGEGNNEGYVELE